MKAFDMLALAPEKITREIMENCLNLLGGVAFIPKYVKGKNPLLALHEGVGKFPNMPQDF
jgi:hypothetical protein